MLEPPLPPDRARRIDLVKAPGIGSLPELDPLPDGLTLPVAIMVGDDVSTDEIMPAGAAALPYRSNITKLADFAFGRIDDGYPDRARRSEQHAIIGGHNYGQGSSREHAVIAPRHLGLRLVITKSYARIHWQNLVNFGVLPLEFMRDEDYDGVDEGDELHVDNLHDALRTGAEITLENLTKGATIATRHRLSIRQVVVVLAGGHIPLLRSKH